MSKSTLYLLVYHDKVNPAHWRLLLVNPGSETVGTTIEVISSFYGGFQHKIVRGYDENHSRTRHSKISLGLIDEALGPTLEQYATGTDPNGVDCNLTIEELQEYNCQTWIKVYIEKLVEKGHLGSGAMSTLQDAPIH